MCDVCDVYGKDYKHHNGDKPLCVSRFYKVFENKVATVQMCKLHSIELFKIGEIRFLKNNIEFAQYLAKRRPKHLEEYEYEF